MENFYYFTGLYVLWVELIWVFSPVEELNNSIELLKFVKETSKKRQKINF